VDRLVEEAYTYVQRVAGPDDLNTLYLQLEYADNVVSKKNRTEALALTAQALAELSRRLPVDHPHQLRFERQLAICMVESGKTAEGFARLERLLRRVREKYPPLSEEVVTTLRAVGVLYSQTEGASKERAIELLEEGFRNALALHGPKHGGVDGWLRNMSAALTDVGRNEDAAKLLEEYLPQFRKRLGRGHHDTVALVINLTHAYLQLKRYADIPPLIDETLTAVADTPHQDPGSIFLLKANRIQSYFGLDRADATAELFAVMDEYWTGKVPNGLPNSSEFFQLVVDCYKLLKNAKRQPQGVRLMEKGLKRAQAAKKNPPTVNEVHAIAHWQFLLAEVYAQADRGAEAVPLLAARMPYIDAQTPPNSPERADALLSAGRVLRLGKQYAEAEPLLRTALSILTSAAASGAGAAPNVNLAANREVARFELSWVLMKQKKFEEAENLAREAFAWSQSNRGPFGRDANNLSDLLLDIYEGWPRPDLTVALVRERIESAKSTFGPDDVRTTNVMAQLGMWLIIKRRGVDAEPVLRECLTIREKTQPDAWNTFNAMSLLGGALLYQKKYTDAEPLLHKGYEGMKQREKTIPPEGATRIPEALDRLIEFSTATDKPDEAKKWRAERAKYPETKEPEAKR